MDSSWNQRVAQAVWQAGLLPEAELHRALAEAGQEDLARFLVRTGRVQAPALQRLLGGSGGWPVVTPHDRTVVPPSGSATPTSGTVAQVLKTAHGTSPGQLMPPGARIGAYELRRLLGRGGMGAVFEAEDPRLARRVALKVLLAGEGASPEQLQRFRVEAQAAGRLQHPHVVQVYDVGEAEGISYLALELVQGPSLRELIEREGPLPPRRAGALVAQVARGVAAAHAQGIVHRDLKPHNVLVAPGDTAKVMDFGLAKATGEAAGAGLTVSGAILGTPSYMSPEQAAGERVGPPADVYGLGAILYECLTGKAPFTGGSIPALIHAVLNKEVTPPRALRPSLHKDVETICLKALAKQPEGRYPSAEALAADLDRWLAGEAIEARPPSGGERLLRWTRRRWAVIVPALVAAVAVLVLLSLVVVGPALAERRGRLERDAAAERAAAYRGRVAAAHAELAALASAAGEGAPERVGARAAELETELAAVRSTVQADPAGPCLDLDPLLAAAWLVQGRARADRGDAAGAEADWARALALGPGSPVGREALAELAAVREGDAAEALIPALQGLPDLSPDARAGLLLARARSSARALDLPGTRGALMGLAALSPAPQLAAGAARLERLLAPLERQLPLPDLAAARHLRARAHPAPRIVALDAACAGAIWRPGPAGPEREVELPPWPEGTLLPGEQLQLADAWLLPGGRALRAATTSQRRLLLGSDRGAPQLLASSTAWPLPQQQGLAFLELDGDPATAELLWAIGPNAGDSRLARVHADGRVELGLLDRGGCSRRAASACYINAWAAGPFGRGGAPGLVLAYGAWYGQDLRRCGPRDPWNASAASPRIGTVQALEGLDLDGDGAAELIAGHVVGEEPDPADVPPGLAAWAWSEGAEPRRLWTLPDPPAEGAGRFRGVSHLVALRIGRAEGLALWTSTGTSSPRTGAGGRWRAAMLGAGGAELLLDEPWRGSREGWPVIGALDWDGDGDDELLCRGAGHPVLLGTGEVPPPAPPAPLSCPAGEVWALEQLHGLGQSDAAWEGLLRHEAARRPSVDSEALGQRLLLERRKAGLERLEPAVEAFLATPGRSQSARARALLLRAEERAKSGDPAASTGAESDLRASNPALLPGREQVVHTRLLEMLELRNGSRLELDFAGRAGGFPSFLASDPLRVRLEAGRGLVALPTRRVGFLAGVPVHLPPGPVRVTLELTVEGRTWGGLIEVGLLRELAAGIADSEGVEGLTVGLGLWTTGDLRTARQAIGPGFGHSALGPRGAILDPESGEPLSAGLSGPHLFRGAYRVVLEHHPSSRWSHLVVIDIERGERLLEQEGSSAQLLPTGPFLAGVHTRLHERDFSGGNFPPEAEVALRRITIEHAGEPEDGAPGLVSAGDAVPPARRAAGLHVLARTERSRGAEALQVYERALAAAATAEQRAALLLRRAELRAGAGDDTGARADLTAALAGSPFGLFLALEDDGRVLPPDLSLLLCRVLRDALRALPAGESPDELLLRAVLHRLRGELPETVAALERAGADAQGEGLAWLRTGLDQDVSRLGAFPRRAALPELPSLLPAWWLPLEDPPGGLEQLLAGRLSAARDPAERLRWLDRAVMLRPEDPQPLYQRAQLLAEDPARSWQAILDLRRVVRLAPEAPAPQLLLGQLRLLGLDWVGGGVALREAVRQGSSREVRELFRELEAKVRWLADDPRWTPFVEGVLGAQASWDAFVDRR